LPPPPAASDAGFGLVGDLPLEARRSSSSLFSFSSSSRTSGVTPLLSTSICFCWYSTESRRSVIIPIIVTTCSAMTGSARPGLVLSLTRTM
jgi:hypothetical protein